MVTAYFNAKYAKKTLSCQKGFQALLNYAAKKEHKMSAVLNPRQLRLTGSTSIENKSQVGNAVPEKKLKLYCERLQRQ